MNQTIARLEGDELVANADTIIEAARAKLKALCHGERWCMSVPVRDEDSDVSLGAVIRLASRLLASERRLQALRVFLDIEGRASNDGSSE